MSHHKQKEQQKEQQKEHKQTDKPEKEKHFSRKSVRFLPSADESIALIDGNSSHTQANFTHEYTALIFSESRGGAGLALLKNEKFAVGEKILVQIAKIYPILSEIVWRDDNDPHFLKIGVKYLA